MMNDCDKTVTEDCDWHFTVEFIKVYVMGIVIIVLVIGGWAAYDLVKYMWPKPRPVWYPPIQYSPYIPRKMPPMPRAANRPYKKEAIEPADLGLNNDDISYIDETDPDQSTEYSEATPDIADSDL